jgi:DNA-binding GntR family transcriptional regulator
MKKRRPGNTVDDLHQTLRERILRSVYFPGMRLSQQALATELKVSRTPLREALSRLAAEGLLVGEPNRGMEIAPVRNEQAEQSYAIRLLIEPPTISVIVDEISDADIDAMERILDEMERAAKRTRDFQDAHLRFHQMTLRHYPEEFRKLIENQYETIYRHQRLYLGRPDVAEHFTMVDRAFCDAVRARDAVVARQIMEFHLTDAAIGLVLDIEPDYRFTTLLLALRGIGIEIEADSVGRIHRPTQIRWTRADYRKMPELGTDNLVYQHATRRPRLQFSTKTPAVPPARRKTSAKSAASR